MRAPDRGLPDRRDFLRTGLGLVIAGSASARAALSAPADLPFRISLAQWSLHRLIFWGGFDHRQFARLARRTLDIEAVEYVNQFFPDRAGDGPYLDDLRRRAEDEGVRSLLIMVDREGRLGEPGRSGRDKAVDRHRRWVEAAARLGCMAIRVNAHSEGPADEQRRLTADGIRALTEHAATHDMSVLIENHGGLSCDGSWLASLIRAVDHPRCGSLPDFGNFEADGRRYDAYGGVRELMPFAGGVSAKSRAFDDRGDERTIDYRRMLRTVVASGYRGYVGIEYEGRELPELEGVRRTKRLLERVGTELAGA